MTWGESIEEPAGSGCRGAHTRVVANDTGLDVRNRTACAKSFAYTDRSANRGDRIDDRRTTNILFNVRTS